MATSRSVRITGIPSRWKFGKLPTEILENEKLTTHEKLLMGCLLWHGEDQVWPGRERLAFFMSCSIGQVRNSIKGLEKKIGLVVKREKGGVNIYDMSGVGHDMTGGRSPHDRGVGHQVTANDTHLNENNLTNGERAPDFPAPDDPPVSPPVKASERKRPAKELWAMVAKWCASFQEVNGFPTSDDAKENARGKIYDMMHDLVSLRGTNDAEAILKQYWSWYARKGLHGGSRFDFVRKQDMLYDMVLEHRKKYGGTH